MENEYNTENIELEHTKAESKSYQICSICVLSIIFGSTRRVGWYYFQSKSFSY